VDFRCEGERGCEATTAVKTLLCRTLPRVLVVWLKRFFRSPDGKQQRIDAPVYHVEDDMNLGPHLDTLAGADGGTRTTVPIGTRYQVRAVVTHIANPGKEKDLDGGHYKCLVRGATAPGDLQSWMEYDDIVVGQRLPSQK